MNESALQAWRDEGMRLLSAVGANEAASRMVDSVLELCELAGVSPADALAKLDA